MQTGQRHEAGGRVHRRFDHARGHGVYAHIAGRVLDRRLRVAAVRPPLVREARTDGTAELACSTSVVVACTTWPEPR
jgi:hypothetical protein